MDLLNSLKKRLLEIGQIQFPADNKEDVESSLAEFKVLLKELRNMKLEINREIKAIRYDYKIEYDRISNSNHFIAGWLFGRSTPGKIRAERKRHLKLQLQNEIRPFEDLKFTIDDVIHQIQEHKRGWELMRKEYVEEMKDNQRDKQEGQQILDQIEKLGDLRDQGILTDEEFNDKKRTLLDRL